MPGVEAKTWQRYSYLARGGDYGKHQRSFLSFLSLQPTMQRNVSAGAAAGSSVETASAEGEEVGGGRKAAPVNLTCFVLLAGAVCVITWGLDHSLFKLHDYKNVQDVYNHIGISFMDTTVYLRLSEENRTVTWATLVVLCVVVLVWCLAAYLYLTRCRTVANAAPVQRFSLKASRSDADFLKHERHY